MARPIKVNAIVISHAPIYKLYQQGIKSAPKEISVFGIGKSRQQLLGKITFNPKEDTVTVVPVDNSGIFSKVVVNIHSNWGNPDWTCMYRIAVHGKESN